MNLNRKYVLVVIPIVTVTMLTGAWAMGWFESEIEDLEKSKPVSKNDEKDFKEKKSGDTDVKGKIEEEEYKVKDTLKNKDDPIEGINNDPIEGINNEDLNDVSIKDDDNSSDDSWYSCIEGPFEDNIKDDPIEDSIKDAPIEDNIKDDPIEDSIKDAPIEDSIKDDPIEDNIKDDDNSSDDSWYSCIEDLENQESDIQESDIQKEVEVYNTENSFGDQNNIKLYNTGYISSLNIEKAYSYYLISYKEDIGLTENEFKLCVAALFVVSKMAHDFGLKGDNSRVTNTLNHGNSKILNNLFGSENGYREFLKNDKTLFNINYALTMLSETASLYSIKKAVDEIKAHCDLIIPPSTKMKLFRLRYQRNGERFSILDIMHVNWMRYVERSF